jgi:hypothetical protein
MDAAEQRNGLRRSGNGSRRVKVPTPPSASRPQGACPIANTGESPHGAIAKWSLAPRLGPSPTNSATASSSKAATPDHCWASKTGWCAPPSDPSWWQRKGFWPKPPARLEQVDNEHPERVQTPSCYDSVSSHHSERIEFSEAQGGSCRRRRRRRLISFMTFMTFRFWSSAFSKISPRWGIRSRGDSPRTTVVASVISVALMGAIALAPIVASARGGGHGGGGGGHGGGGGEHGGGSGMSGGHGGGMGGHGMGGHGMSGGNSGMGMAGGRGFAAGHAFHRGGNFHTGRFSPRLS